MSNQDPKISAFARSIMRQAGKGQDISTSQADDLVRSRKEAEETATVQQLQQTFGAAAGRIAEGLHNEYDRISKEKIDERSPLYRHMSDEARMSATREHREQLARQAYAQATERYTQVIRERNQKLAERKRQAEEQLYGAGQNAEVLARLATGTDDQVLAAARVAARTNNPELRKAAIATAKERDLGEALAEVLSDKERDLLNELAQAPDAEVMARAADAARVLPAVDTARIMPPANGAT